MLNLNRRDKVAEPADTAKPALKPAIYDPPATGALGGAPRAATPSAPAPDATVADVVRPLAPPAASA